ncbi:MAG: tetratricopeptide repeat protein [Saccharothrix sp.]|nr:tetratricopeptide repeat protein [Saccharothrix sp.]
MCTCFARPARRPDGHRWLPERGPGGEASAVEFRVLGRLEVWTGGRLLDVGHAKRRCVAAVLLAEANRVVTTEQLLERVWAGRPPHKARQAVSNYVSQLRQLLAGAVEGGPTIRRRDEGYTLLVDPDHVDLHLFRRLVVEARAETDQRRALELLERADRLWRGEAFEGLDTPWLVALREGLARERFAADSDRVDLALAQGRHAAVLPELTDRAAAHPLDERVAAQLVLALYRDGRQADALARYQDIRTRLADELGTDPGPDLRELHHRVLTADPGLTPPPRAAGVPVPRQLPVPPHSFTGRAPELARLDEALATRTADAVVISAIGGAGGIGKTWLALHWAHRNADRFPDGQLFVDLHGFSHADRPVTPDTALFGFLVALGIAPDRVPADQDAKAALYRSVVADKRMLVVLDNAATADQVVPLLPGSRSCTVLITGRTRLASLIDRNGARHLQLDVLTAAEARELLISRLGRERLTGAEPDATGDLVALCGAYPLALSITARNAATRPTIPLAEIAAELRELGLDVLDHDTDPAASLPAVMSWSLRRLTDHQRTLFGLLGIAPGPDTTLPAAAALTGLPKALARKDLSALEEASLVERRPGGRYAMHDLVRDYAVTTARATVPDDVREAALVRSVDFHLHTAFAADRLLNPQRTLLRPDPPAPGVEPHPLPDAGAAMAWLEAEHATLLATQRTAVVLRRHDVVWHLAWVLDTFHYRRGHLRDALGVWQAALDAAAHLPDPTIRSRTHRLLGHTWSRLGRNEEATEHMNRALALAVGHDDPTEQAHTHRTLATVWARRGDDRQALDHAGHALDLYRGLDEPVREADALNLVGWYAARLGDYDTAREHCLAALTLHRHHRDPDGEANTLDSLGHIAHRTGDHRQAVDHYDQALTLLRALGNAYEVAETLDNIGHPHAALGHHDQARDAWREALDLYRDQGRDTAADRVRHQLDGLPGHLGHLGRSADRGTHR